MPNNESMIRTKSMTWMSDVWFGWRSVWNDAWAVWLAEWALTWWISSMTLTWWLSDMMLEVGNTCYWTDTNVRNCICKQYERQIEHAQTCHTSYKSMKPLAYKTMHKTRIQTCIHSATLGVAWTPLIGVFLRCHTQVCVYKTPIVVYMANGKEHVM